MFCGYNATCGPPHFWQIPYRATKAHTHTQQNCNTMQHNTYTPQQTLQINTFIYIWQSMSSATCTQNTKISQLTRHNTHKLANTATQPSYIGHTLPHATCINTLSINKTAQLVHIMANTAPQHSCATSTHHNQNLGLTCTYRAMQQTCHSHTWCQLPL